MHKSPTFDEIDSQLKLTKGMEQSALKQLKEALTTQFSDEMFKDRLTQEEKIEVHKTTILTC